MGKVYDALRRAEARRAQGTPAPAGSGALARALAEPAAQPEPGHWLARLRRAPRAGSASGDPATSKRRITLLEPGSFVSEQFRTLRARIDSLAAERPLRSLAVTSALAGEGKTVAAVNLALVSAMSLGRRVLLVDCDLRRPQVHTCLGLRPAAGLAEVLLEQAELAAAVTEVAGVPLQVLAVRSQPSNPSELLASDRMRRLIEEAEGAYDRVVLDTPPVLSLPDAKVVSDLCDGTLVVVRAGATPADELAAALDVIDRRRILGLVLNGVEDASERYGYPA